MPISTEYLLQRARAIMPGLQIEYYERDEEGLINDILIVNQQWVFRFAKSEEYAKLLRNEIKILNLIRPYLDILIPEATYENTDYMVYPFLDGQPLSRNGLIGFDKTTQRKIAEQLGSFLYQLHQLSNMRGAWDLPLTRAPVKRARWLEVQSKVKEHLYPLFQQYQREWAEDLFNSVLDDPASSDYPLALIHGDLASYHILFDEQEKKIRGVIDFGMAGLGDPASDFGNLIQIYGESFVGLMQNQYPDLSNFLPRARFYAQLLELEWVLNGFESGDTFWFTAHLGGARDIY
jgi:aminoglycoside 2''-phosphotransferase